MSLLPVSDEILAKNLGQMSKSLKQLEIDIKNVQNQKASADITDEDRFADVMSEFVSYVSSYIVDMNSMSLYRLLIYDWSVYVPAGQGTVGNMHSNARTNADPIQ